MKNWLMIFIVLQLGVAVAAQAEVEFNKVACLKALPAGYSILCNLHEEQFNSDSFQKEAIYGYSYSNCNKFSGEISAATSSAVPCVVYFVDSDSKKEIALQSIFGITPKYPLSYKGLLTVFIVRPRGRQMGYGSSAQRQFGDMSSSRQYGDSNVSRQMGDGLTTGSRGSSQMQ